MKQLGGLKHRWINWAKQRTVTELPAPHLTAREATSSTDEHSNVLLLGELLRVALHVAARSDVDVLGTLCEVLLSLGKLLLLLHRPGLVLPQVLLALICLQGFL